MSKTESRQILLAKSASNPEHAHRLAERILSQEVPGASGRAKRISRKKALAAFSGSLLVEQGEHFQPAPYCTHVDIQDFGFGCKSKRITKKHAEREFSK